MSTFELWNTSSGNLLGTFPTEAEALAAVREAIQRHGEGYVDTLALGRENSRGASRIVAAGAPLVERAAKAQLPMSPRPARRDTRIA